MKFTIQQIKEQPNQLLKLDEKLDIKDALIERMSSITDVQNTEVDGYYAAIDYEVVLHCTIDTDLTLPSTRTLEPVTIHLTIPVKERYVTNNQETNLDEHEEVTIVVEDEILNLQEVVIDNILLNIPMKIIGEDETDDTLPSGNDWTVMTEESYLQQQADENESAVDPRFAALQDLLDKED